MGPRNYRREMDDAGYLRELTVADPFKIFTGKTVHRRCREGDDCQGPGCRVHTGKTRSKRGQGNG